VHPLQWPSLVLVGLGLPLLPPLLRSRRFAPDCLLSLAGTLLLSPLGLCLLIMVSSWNLAWLRVCWRNSLVPRGFMLPPLSLAGHALPPVWFPVGLRSFLCPAIHFLCVDLNSDLPLGFACPFGQAICPRYFTYCVCRRVHDFVQLAPWSVPWFIRMGSITGLRVGSLLVLGSGYSFLNGLEVSLLFLGCLLFG